MIDMICDVSAMNPLAEEYHITAGAWQAPTIGLVGKSYDFE
jgi:hypothetical protein